VKFICFTYTTISIIYWNMDTFRSLTPDKVDRRMIVRSVNGRAMGNFLKIPIALSRPYLSKVLKDKDLPMDYNCTPQMDKKIISPRPATCSITPSPAGARLANPSRWCLFFLHWAICMVKCASGLIKLTCRSFIRPFPETHAILC
jgi:hypothetical protein